MWTSRCGQPGQPHGLCSWRLCTARWSPLWWRWRIGRGKRRRGDVGRRRTFAGHSMITLPESWNCDRSVFNNIVVLCHDTVSHMCEINVHVFNVHVYCSVFCCCRCCANLILSLVFLLHDAVWARYAWSVILSVCLSVTFASTTCVSVLICY